MTQVLGSIRREGISVLRESPEDVIDLVFVHGLNGHPINTWTQGTKDDAFRWIDQLPTDSIRARILTFGYDATFDSGSENLMGLRQHTEALLLHLKNKRIGSLGLRPIAFVCHSLGGLVVKQALIVSSKKAEYQSLYWSASAIFFFGTPHRGSQLLQLNHRVQIVEKIAKVAGYRIPDNIRSLLEPGSNELFGVNDDFSDVKRNIIIVNFYEMKKTPLINALVVEKESAITFHTGEVNAALMRTHQELVCYSNENDDTFRFVAETLTSKLLEACGARTSSEATRLHALRNQYLNIFEFNDSTGRLDEISPPHENTHAWIWKDEVGIDAWSKERGGLLWICGKPGSGKSVLMKKLCSELESKTGEDVVIIPYFFNNRGSPLQKSLNGMLRAFIAGILGQTSPIHDAALMAYHNRGSDLPLGNKKWDTIKLKKLLLELLSPQSNCSQIFFLVDALDECTGDSVNSVGKFLKELTELSNDNSSVKVCASSRLQPFPLDHGNGNHVVSIHDWTHDDIVNYVHDQLVDLVTVEEEDIIAETASAIISKADGVFLWVKITLERLQDVLNAGGTAADYQGLLSELPDDLMGIYGDILENVDLQHHLERNVLLGIVLCCFEPLTLSELRVAFNLSINPTLHSQAMMKKSQKVILADSVMIRVIQSRCRGLLETKRHDDKMVVQFIHQSVKDYLESEGCHLCDSARNRLSATGHDLLSKACLRYCSFPELHQIRDDLQSSGGASFNARLAQVEQQSPFASYAITSWAKHCRESEKAGIAQTDELMKFQAAGDEVFGTWIDLYRFADPDEPLPRETTMFHVATQNNLQDFVRKTLDTSTEKTLPKETKEYCLQLAAKHGHKDLVTFFIDRGVDFNATGGEYYTALTAAALSGEKDIVQILLNAKSDESLSGPQWQTPLNAAARRGYDDIVGLILHFSEKEDLWIDLQETLAQAASYGEFKVVETLLEAGADATRYDDSGWSVLSKCIESATPELVNLLVQQGADVTARLKPGLTVLHWTSYHGNRDTVKLLLDLGADPNNLDFQGSTPMHWACSSPDPGVLQTLIDAGADCNARNQYMMTPLHIACAKSSLSEVQELITAEADLQVLDNFEMSLVHYASLNKSEAIIGTFLASQSEMDLDFAGKDIFQRRPVHLAAEFGSYKSLKLLAPSKNELFNRDIDGRAVIHAAAHNSSSRALRYCLECGADPSHIDNGNMTALHHIFAASSQLPPLNLTYLETFNIRGMVSIFIAFLSYMSQREEEMLQATIEKIDMLLDHGTNIDAQDNDGNTALHLSCQKNEAKAIEHLLNRGARTDIRNSEGFLAKDGAHSDLVLAMFPA